MAISAILEKLTTDPKARGALVPAEKSLAKIDLSLTAIERVGQQIEQQGEAATRKILKAAASEIESIRLRTDQLKTEVETVKAEKKKALPIEMSGLNRRIKLALDELKKLERTMSALQRPAAKIKKESQIALAAETAKANVLAEARAFIAAVKEKYPDIKTLKLDVLGIFRNKAGLPALTLHSLASPKSQIVVSGREGFSLKGGTSSLPISKELASKLREIVIKATGVEPGKSLKSGSKLTHGSYYSHYEDRYIETSSTTSVPPKIVLSCELPIGAAVIPDEVRPIIRSAQSSKLFDEVVLLAEVEKWRVTYHGRLDGHKPKIAGRVISQTKSAAKPLPAPRYDPWDPLVLGLKKFGDKVYAFQIAAFNLTKLENYVDSEFAEKP